MKESRDHMRLTDINLRDPFILPYEGTYYMYGSRVGAQFGFDVYTSCDLCEWHGPESVFEKCADFWGETDFWAPEVHFYHGSFYMFASFRSSHRRRGTAVLICDTPDGQFREHSHGALTPDSWECLDGTLYVEKDGTPYLVFSHEWVQIKNGAICAMRLSEDLKEAASSPVTLWHAGDASWVSAFPEQDCYVTDGPFLRRAGKELICLWSSFDENGYAIAAARSSDGTLLGTWKAESEPILRGDGGHGMLFTDFSGKQKLVLHSPNSDRMERPVIYDMPDGMLTV